MPCYHIGNAIVCTRVNAKPAPPCACGNERTRECDWKVLKYRGTRGGVLRKPKQGTCDAPLCDACTYSPAAEKDLCPEHAAKWKARLQTEGELS